MKTYTIALLILSITQAPARDYLDTPATSADSFLERQQNERIIEQNERMIALQKEAARQAEAARVYAETDAAIARLRQQTAEMRPPPAPVDTRPQTTGQEYLAHFQRQQQSRAAGFTEAAILAAAAEIRAIRANAALTEGEKNLNVGLVIYKLTTGKP